MNVSLWRGLWISCYVANWLVGRSKQYVSNVGMLQPLLKYQMWSRYSEIGWKYGMYCCGRSSLGEHFGDIFAIILIPFWFHFEFIMVSFWYHFAVSLNSLWYHFGFILVSVWYHFVFILVSFWYHFEGIRETTKIVPFWRFQEKWFGTPLTGNFLVKEPQMEMTFLTGDFLVKDGL